MTKPCLDCGDCGEGLPTGKFPNDPIKVELCVVFCLSRKEFCELKKQGKTKPRPSQIAERRMNDPAIKARMQKAIQRSGRFPRGTGAIPEKPHAVPWNKPVPGTWKRAPMTGARLKRMLAPIKERIEREIKAKVAQVMKRKLAKKAATVWLKAIPVVNVISTVYDVYYIASTGYDLYKMIDEAMKQFQGKVFEIRPDVSISGPDGQLHDIYDFMFDGDSLDNNPRQKELYKEALGNKVDINTRTISQENCKCV